MSYILDIATAVPSFRIEKDNFVTFYTQSIDSDKMAGVAKKQKLLNTKTKIETRYSCIPDYNGKEYELYARGNCLQPIEKRMALYKEKIMPLASEAIDKLLEQTNIKPKDITHLITVSCTGMMAPGLEFLIADEYKLEHTEKTALNFLGCYAGLKSLKQAHYIAQSNPDACILIVSAELCSLHFYPSAVDEDIIANLLFSDGAAAAMVCGVKNKLAENKAVLQINTIGSAYIPGTADLMTWNVSSSAFRMHLSSAVVNAIKENIYDAVRNFLGNEIVETEYWAIHPGGAKIVEAVKESLDLNDSDVADSLSILKQYGNMSSPTILFILKNIFNKIKEAKFEESKKVFSCAFGPGLNIEMVSLSVINASWAKKAKNSVPNYAVQV